MHLRRRSSAALLAALTLFSTACATLQESSREPIEGDQGAIRVAVFADDDTRAEGRLLAEPVAGVLERRDGRSWTPVFRSLDPVWSVTGLEPGRYRVSFDATLDAGGRPDDLERPVDREVEVRAGEAAEVVLVLDHVSPATVAVGAAAVVLAAVLLHEWLDDLDLPDPPAPPAWAVEAAFWIALDVVQASRGWQPGSPVPQVTSHFPRAGQVVEPGEVRVIFVLSGSIDPSLLPADAVTVETDEGFELPGATSWDAERWWLVWEPDEALPAGARLHVTLHARELAESTGLELAGATGFAFETAPAPGPRA